MTGINTHFRLALLSILALLLMGTLSFAFYKLRAENLETARLLGVLQESEKKEETARKVRELQESASADIAAFEALALSPETLVPTIESIEDAGRALGLATEIVSVTREGEAGAGTQTVKIVVESTGSWRGNFLFLKALENLPQRAKIESTHFSKAESLWRSRMELTLLSFD
jgi:hypothetical protein